MDLETHSWPTADTRAVLLLGWPTRHSLSPQIHNAAFRAEGLDLVYLAAPTPPDALRTAVSGLGAIGAVGANVTVPHKQAVVAACDTLTEEAALIGAVNTLVWTADGLLGDNSDARGLEQALREDIDPSPGEPWVLFGTGGAARAAAVSIGRFGGSVVVVGRRADAAAEVAALATRAGATAAEVIPVSSGDVLAAVVAGARVVLNATPLGMHDEPLPAPMMHLDPGQVAYDLVYDPVPTPFLAAAADRGVDAFHGLSMLVGQAVVSFERWTGRAAPRQVMGQAATRALADRRDATA